MTLEDQAEKGFLTDQDIDEVSEKSDEHAPDALAPEPDGAATAVIAPTSRALRRRSRASTCRSSTFGRGRARRATITSRDSRGQLSNGLTVLHAHVPGRALLAAHLLLPGGGW